MQQTQSFFFLFVCLSLNHWPLVFSGIFTFCEYNFNLTNCKDIKPMICCSLQIQMPVGAVELNCGSGLLWHPHMAWKCTKVSSFSTVHRHLAVFLKGRCWSNLVSYCNTRIQQISVNSTVCGLRSNISSESTTHQQEGHFPGDKSQMTEGITRINGPPLPHLYNN